MSVHATDLVRIRKRQSPSCSTGGTSSLLPIPIRVLPSGLPPVRQNLLYSWIVAHGQVGTALGAAGPGPGETSPRRGGVRPLLIVGAGADPKATPLITYTVGKFFCHAGARREQHAPCSCAPPWLRISNALAIFAPLWQLCFNYFG